MRKESLKKVRLMTTSAVLAAAYVVLAMLCESVGLLKYAIQLRIPEALCVLCAFTPAAIPGVTIGCLLSNLLSGCAPLDIVCGTLATFIGVSLGRLISANRKKSIPNLFLATLPTLLSNALILPPVIMYSYGSELALPIMYVTVAIGESLSACVLGTVLGKALAKIKLKLD